MSERLYCLQALPAKIFSMALDGSDLKIIAENLVEIPDGIAIDGKHQNLYFSNMGEMGNNEQFPYNDGSIERIHLNNQEKTNIIPAGKTFTPKQLILDRKEQKLYWADREGMRIMRADMDGTNLETLIISGQGEVDRKDENHHCVGICLDKKRSQFLWTQKGPAKGGQGRLFRANINCPKGKTAIDRDDIELLIDHLPEPIDLEYDEAKQTLYWTDRGAAPDGNSLNCCILTDKGIKDQEIIARGFHEAIGLAISFEKQLAFVSDLSGSIYSISLAPPYSKKVIYQGQMLTGLALS